MPAPTFHVFSFSFLFFFLPGRYRFDRLAAAQANAVAIVGVSGLKFPWEGGATGLEACPYGAYQNSVHEIHISGDVGLAFWQ
jgi:trehalose/maltose hydrolase-like predicted phosphorylase